MKKYIILIASIVAISCQEKIKKEPTSVTTETKIVEKDTLNQQISDTIYLKNKNKNGVFYAESALDSIHSKVYLKFKNESASKMIATIIPSTGKGNIRFSQIIYPDNSSNGPFGYKLDTEVNQKGEYILVVGHSLMADAPFIGAFKVKVRLIN